MTRTIALIPAIALALAACGETGEDADVDIVAAGNETAVEPTGLAPPDRDVFAQAYAAACPSAEAVSTAVCEAGGIGGSEFICEFGLGDDDARRYEATLAENDDATGWMLAEPDAACAVGEG